MTKDKNTILKLDPFEFGAVLESLIDERNGLKREDKPTDTVDSVILKMSRAKNGQEQERDRDEAR